MVHLSSIDWVQQVWDAVVLSLAAQNPNRTTFLCFCHWIIISQHWSERKEKIIGWRQKRKEIILNEWSTQRVSAMLSRVPRSPNTSLGSDFTLAAAVYVQSSIDTVSYALISLLSRSCAALNIPALAVEKTDEYSTETGVANPFDTTPFCRSHIGLVNYSLFHFKALQSGYFFFLQQRYLI